MYDFFENEHHDLRLDIIKNISTTKQALENIRKRPRLNCKAVAAQIAAKEDAKYLDAKNIEKAEKKFKSRWHVQKMLANDQMLLPKNTQTLKLLYGEFKPTVASATKCVCSKTIREYLRC